MMGLLDLYGEVGTTNVQGEKVKKLDIMILSLKRAQSVALLCSEEDELPIIIDADNPKYIVIFDVNISIGTIFGIYKRDDTTLKTTMNEVLKPGRDLMCSGYAAYSNSTMFVITLGEGVYGFTLDTNCGEFILTHPNIIIQYIQ